MVVKMRIEEKKDFVELTIKDSVRLPETDIILEKGDKIFIPNPEFLERTQQGVVISKTDSSKVQSLLLDYSSGGLLDYSIQGGTRIVVGDSESYYSLLGLLDSYGIEYIRF